MEMILKSELKIIEQSINDSPLQAFSWSLLSSITRFSNSFWSAMAAASAEWCFERGPKSFVKTSFMSSCLILILRDSNIRTNSVSEGVRKMVAVPDEPARAVLPIRWT